MRHKRETPPRALLESMGIDPVEYQRLSELLDGGRWEEKFGNPGPPPEGMMWLPPGMLEGLLVQFRTVDREAPAQLALTDLQAHRTLFSIRTFANRWGWTVSRTRRTIEDFDGGDKTPKRPRYGVVYAISTEAPDAPVKVGFTATTGAERLQALQTGSPVPLVLLTEVPAPATAERRLHRELKAHRLHGEWFAREPALSALERLRSTT